MTSHPRQSDFWPSADSLIGLSVKLERVADRPCHGNVAEISAGCGPHQYALRCVVCGRHRGWLPKSAVGFLRETVRAFGRPSEPMTYRDQSSLAAVSTGGEGNARVLPSHDNGDHVMLMTKYAGSRFIDLDDVSEGPIRQEIVEVAIGQYDKPVLKFRSGLQFSVNVTNVGILIEAFGEDSDSWLGEMIELYSGQLKFKGELKPGVLIRPVALPPGVEKKPLPKRRPRADDTFGGPTDM